MKLSERFQLIKAAITPYSFTDKALIENTLTQKGYEFDAYLNTGDYRSVNRGNGPLSDAISLFDNSTSDYSFSYSGVNDAIKAYAKCPPVTSIVNKKAQALVNGKTWILNTQGKAKGKEATGTEANKVRNLFNQPNPLQSGKQFEAQNYIYQQLCGYAVVLAIKPFGFTNMVDTVSLWNLPPQLLEINEKRFKPLAINKITDIISSVYLVYEDERTELNVDDLIILRDFVPSFGSPVIPSSRIKSVAMPINNVIGAYESRNVLINNRGPQYVISSNKSDESGNIALSPHEKEQIQNDFMRYGIRRGQWKQIITNQNINVATIGSNTKDLMLFEEIEGSTMAICDAFGYPYRLMAAEKSASYNDVSEFKKMLYQDTIIPEGESNYEQYDAAFNLSQYNLNISKDYSHIPALQANAVEMANARKARNEALEKEYRYDGITLNRWRELNDEDPITGGDVYFSEWLAAGNTDPYARNAGSAAPAQDGQPLNNTTNGTDTANNAA